MAASCEKVVTEAQPASEGIRLWPGFDTTSDNFISVTGVRALQYVSIDHEETDSRLGSFTQKCDYQFRH